MKTVQTLLQQLTDPKIILTEIRETLRMSVPEFLDAEVKYSEAASNLKSVLGDRITPSVGEFIAALETELVYDIIYIGWQGFKFNLDIFNAPINAMLLRGDYEELYQERRLGTLPMAKKTRDTIKEFYEVMREKYADKLELTDDIAEFYSYLQTYGYKLAHYFGFRLADRFLPYVIPGYVDDSVNTGYYRRLLQEHLGVDIGQLEK